MTAPWRLPAAPTPGARVAVASPAGAPDPQKLEQGVELLRGRELEVMRSAPGKLFVGYSDVTAGHDVIGAHLGVPTQHGPMPAYGPLLSSRGSRRALCDVLSDHDRGRVIGPQDIGLPPPRILAGGTAGSTAAGGCVTLLSAQIGSVSPRGWTRRRGR